MKSISKTKVLSAAHHIKNHKREFDILKSLRHPCIIQLKYAFQTKTKLKFVMEFGQGGDMFSLLARNGALTEVQAKFYIGQLALVIDYGNLEKSVCKSVMRRRVASSIKNSNVFFFFLKGEIQNIRRVWESLFPGICHLHKNNIMYRDLKTENILLNGAGHVKLADFGLSRRVQGGEKAYSFSGTPEYSEV